ncbi:MAG TPA: outer membrane beta-barrel protein [Pyrinomonadaceae bacterium]|jgi:hypothetical protein
MNTRALLAFASLTFLLLSLAPAAAAQERDAPKVEVGIQFTSLSVNLPGFGGTENAAGVGGRVTYNLTDYFAVEAEGNLLPTGLRRTYVTGGAAQQLQAGVKAGKRWNRFGLFAKARPGLVSFGDTETPVLVESGGFTNVDFTRERKTHFSMDVGGVMEFYPSRKVLVRFDAGDTIIRFGEHPELLPSAAIPFDLFVGLAPSEITHNFQFTGGVAYRFGGGGDDAGAAQSAPAGRAGRRFEAGAQFSSLMLRLSPERFGFTGPVIVDEGSQAEAGGGARLGFNATDNLAFEAEGNFYPRRRFGGDTTVGGYPSQLQAGVKYGRRFDRFGVFAKARPGFVNFSSVSTVEHYETFPFGGQVFFIPVFADRNRTYFSMDVGGVVELYPSSRFFTRFDVGDTMIRYPERDNPRAFLATPPPRIPSELRHNLQVTAGLGFRF